MEVVGYLTNYIKNMEVKEISRDEAMKRIIDWHKKFLRCFNCGETRSVKYESGGNHYCNACILSIERKTE